MSDPFLPDNSGYGYGSAGSLFGGLSLLGGGGGYGASDPYAGMSPYEAMSMQNQNRQLEIMGQMAQPPSAFQQGVGTFGAITQGLASLGNIWMGLKGMKLQEKAFKFNKEVTNTNLNNSIRDYNRRLTDTLANRSLNNGLGSGWVSEQLAKYQAKRG